jgi:hypothetical protein
LHEVGVHGDLEFFGRDQAPGFEEVPGEFVVCYLVEFDAYPAAYAYVGWFEEFSGRGADERHLGSGNGWNPDGYVAVVMVIVGEHGEDFLADEEGGFAVRELLGGAGEGGADSADSVEVSVMLIEFLSWDRHGRVLTAG